MRSKLRTTVYARMEEMSFRSGAAAAAGTLAVVGTAIALAVTLSGHSAAATSAPGPTAPARSAPSVPPASSSSVNPPTRSSTPVRSASHPVSPQAYAPAYGITTPHKTRAAAPLPEARLGPPPSPPRRLPNPHDPAPPPDPWGLPF
jgi:hypothetical protein